MNALPNTSRSDLLEYMRSLPKIELHRHLEGSLRLETLANIAREYGGDLPTHDEEGLRPYVQWQGNNSPDFLDFLRKFKFLRRFFSTPQAVIYISREAVWDAFLDNVRYMELRFNPVALAKHQAFSYEEVSDWVVIGLEKAQEKIQKQKKTWQSELEEVEAELERIEAGILTVTERLKELQGHVAIIGKGNPVAITGQQAFIQAFIAEEKSLVLNKEVLEDTRQRLRERRVALQNDLNREIMVRLIVQIGRDESVNLGWRLAKVAVARMDRGFVGLDLAGDEVNHPGEHFAEVFRWAKEAGIHITIHGGEAGPASNVRMAVDLMGAERVGHGVHALEDISVIDMLRRKAIALEMCPTSNFQTGAVVNLAKHPLWAYHNLSLIVTLNTDDPCVSDTTLSHEYFISNREIGVPIKALLEMTMNAANVVFLPPDERRELVAWFEEALRPYNMGRPVRSLVPDWRACS